MKHAILILIAAVAAAGCSKEYERKEVAPEELAHVRQMLQDLRKAPEGKLQEALKAQAAEGLDELQRKALSMTMGDVVKAKTAELESMDQFGDRVVRALIRVEDDQGAHTVCFLLLRESGTLRWAGRN
jgi:hypothetical protein